MTEQPGPAEGSAVDQLKQLFKDRLNQGVGVAATAAGQQAGMLAQAVRQAGEEMRQQGQENQGRMADRVAAPVQRLSGNLTKADPQELTSVTALKPKLSEQGQQLKTQTSEQLKQQTNTRVAQAAQGVTALNLGLLQTGGQLRAQGQEIPALLLEALVEKLEPASNYLTSSDADRLLNDVAAYGGQARTRLSSASSAVSRGQQAAAAKSTQTVKQTGSGYVATRCFP